MGKHLATNCVAQIVCFSWVAMFLHTTSASACDMGLQPKLSEADLINKAKNDAFASLENADMAFEGTLTKMIPEAVTDFQDLADATFKILKCLKGRCGKSVTFKVQLSGDCSELPSFAPEDVKSGKHFWVTLTYSRKLNQYIWDGESTTSLPVKL